MLKAALETATTIASKSPVVVQGTKISLVYSRDHPVPDSLQHVVCIYFTLLLDNALTGLISFHQLAFHGNTV